MAQGFRYKWEAIWLLVLAVLLVLTFRVPAFEENRVAILFYGVLVFLIIALRRHIEWQAFGIGLYKTKWGLALMERWGKRWQGFIQLLALIGIGVGFAGMIFIAWNLLYGFWNLIFDPAAPPVVSPVVPGFNIPGLGLKVPLITGWLALFVVIVIHEFSHGVVARAHDIKVKSSGLLVFFVLGGAFVEPNEKQLARKSREARYGMFAAGPFSNIVTGLLFAVVMGFLLVPLLSGMTTSAGVEITSVREGFPAEAAGLEAGMVVTSIGERTVVNYDEFSSALEDVLPGETVMLGTQQGSFPVETVESPEGGEQGYLGVNLKSARDPKVNAAWYGAALAIVVWLQGFFQWLVILSLGLGLANLLPLGPLDGGHMLRDAARQITGSKKRGDWWWKRVSVVTLALILVLLLVPLVKAVV